MILSISKDFCHLRRMTPVNTIIPLQTDSTDIRAYVDFTQTIARKLFDATSSFLIQEWADSTCLLSYIYIYLISSQVMKSLGGVADPTPSSQMYVFSFFSLSAAYWQESCLFSAHRLREHGVFLAVRGAIRRKTILQDC